MAEPVGNLDADTAKRCRHIWRALREAFDAVIEEPPGSEGWTPEQREIWRDMWIDAGRLVNGLERFRKASGL